MYQHKSTDFDYLIHQFQEQIIQDKQNVDMIYKSTSQKIAKTLGLPITSAYEKLEKNTYDDSYNDFKIWYEKTERIKDNLQNKIHKNKIDERSNRIEINNTMHCYSMWLIDSIKKEYKEKYNKVLEDNIVYTTLITIKERFSLDEESDFARNLDFYKSFDNYLEIRLDSPEEWGYKQNLFINYIEKSDYDNTISKEEFETIRNYIYNTILYLIIPEIKQIYGKIKFSRQMTTENFVHQNRKIKEITENINKRLQTFSN